MKEDIFLKTGITTSYSKETKNEKWTSKVLKIIDEHKLIMSLLVIVMICSILNFWLIYSFLDILSKQI